MASLRSDCTEHAADSQLTQALLSGMYVAFAEAIER
jgi:hypothetical protein